LQVNHRDEWLQCLRATFDAMDVDKDGRLKPSEILHALQDKLPEAEVRGAMLLLLLLLLLLLGVGMGWVRASSAPVWTRDGLKQILHGLWDKLTEVKV
jgi:hypothetical protein